MLIHPQFDPVAISIGPLSVHWYGLMYLAGFAAFLLLGRRRAATQPWHGISGTDLDDLLTWGVVGVIAGGRLGQVLFYEPAYYLAHPLEILAVWKGGMSFHGGFLGVLVAMALWGRRRGKRAGAAFPCELASGLSRSGVRTRPDNFSRDAVGVRPADSRAAGAFQHPAL
jgi:phosphatidylglycerol:prolipoprotein diacylglycerol transferase